MNRDFTVIERKLLVSQKEKKKTKSIQVINVQLVFLSKIATQHNGLQKAGWK